MDKKPSDFGSTLQFAAWLLGLGALFAFAYWAIRVGMLLMQIYLWESRRRDIRQQPKVRQWAA